MDGRPRGATVIRPWVFTSEQPGITTRHVFSAGAHYDPANLAFGRVVGCDEHTVAAGAGFDRHAHRGVVIVSWVLAGALRHAGPSEELLVRPGEVLVQATGDGITHTETNAGPDELVFVQTTLLAETDRSVWLGPPPVALPGGGTFRLGAPGPSSFAVRTGPDVLVVDL